MKQYTVIYAITRDLRTADGGNRPPQHECHHHLARVTAPDPRAAEELCRVNVLPGFTCQALVMFEGALIALDVGDHVMHHAFSVKE